MEWRVSAKIVSVACMRDSRHWAGVIKRSAGYAVMLFDVDGPSGTEPLSFDLNMERSSDPTLAGTLPEGRLLAIGWGFTENGQVYAARFFPNSEAEHPQHLRIPVPSGNANSVTPPVLSPAGDRLAWFVRSRRIPLGWPATHRFWTLLKTAPSWQIGLWTTRPDGSDPVEIGHYTPKDNNDCPSLLQWTPDGRSLSFRYQGALYCVPAR